MPFIIAPLSDVKGPNSYPEFIDAMRAVQNAAMARASALFSGDSAAGGLIPGENEYGIGPMRKNDMSTNTTDSTPSGSYTFRKSITATGWQDIFNFTTRKDIITGIAGFLITDNALNILQFRMEIGTRLFPIWDIQEAQRYDKFAIILKTDVGGELVADPGTRVLIRIYAETVGIQRVTPIGLQLFRRTDLVLTET